MEYAFMASSTLGFRLNCLPLKSKDSSLVILGKTKKAKRACSFACGDFVIRTEHKHGDVSLASSSSSSSFDTRGYKTSRKKKEGCMSLASLGISPEKSNNVSGALPFVVAGTAALALINPASYAWVSKEYYAPALEGIMLSIGIKLSIEDFTLAFQRPVPLTLGFLAQYLLKPILGLVIARIFRTPPIFAAGLILTACVSGAQLSSYASFLSKGDVALSILLTSCTTISFVILTPLLTCLLLGLVVPVDALAMSKSILQVVIAPIAMGLSLNAYAKSVVRAIKPFMPYMAMICASLYIGSPLASNWSQILSMEGLRLLLPVLSFHIMSFAIGYWLPKLLRQEEDVCKTISLCSGKQSSSLAGMLATQFLGSTQAVPAACSVVAMAIMGLTLASFWGRGLRILDLPLLILHRAKMKISIIFEIAEVLTGRDNVYQA